MAMTKMRENVVESVKLPRFKRCELERILSKIDGDPFNTRGDCAFWMGGAIGTRIRKGGPTHKGSKHGLSSIMRGGVRKTSYVHRMFYHAFKGDLSTTDLHVLHKCPTDSDGQCVALGHLELGTHKDNMNDMVKAGNNYRPNPRKLTDDQVRQVRGMYRTGSCRHAIARVFSVNSTCITRIITG